ncbi:sugar kinase [Nonlabens ulvanivorans]|uniref:2-dehydro-3-deoxygluconate kinase n=2 Tax=Nonlabens ulvanivorans TaxID=906888 RepID=A0A090QIS1_NONUL|nr:sugar kinase [Nonlabens ulvanivorans]GAL01709.1 2-dehydro-3-deoxygluconate kinase [Nonlabens ulvanivorans]
MKQKVVTIGEVLMRLTVPDYKRLFQTVNFDVTFGGSEANVGVSLAHFGLDSTHITALPDHNLGERVERFLKLNGVSGEGIVRKEGRLGVYYLETGAMQRPSRIVYDRFDSTFVHLKEDEVNWEVVFKDASWFHYSGITPAISQNAADITLRALKEAKKRGVTTSGDINYRRNLWQYGKQPLDIMPGLVELTDVVIGGRVDLENCLGIQDEDWQANCDKVLKKYPHIKAFSKTVRNAMTASRNELSGLLYTDGKLYTSKNYDMKNIVDRIGGGDAFMAGLIYGFLNLDPQETVEFGVAASVLKHSTIGDVNLSSKEEVEELVKGDNVGRLLR